MLLRPGTSRQAETTMIAPVLREQSNGMRATGQLGGRAHISEIQAAQAAYDAKSGPPPCPDAELPDEDAAAS